MVLRKGIFALIFCLGASLAFAAPDYQIEIDLQQQMAYLIRGRQLVLASPISSGRAGHITETGTFKIIEKERNHFSTMYGKIVDASGHTIVGDADADMHVPRGAKFVPAPMRYFMRFHSATGLHAGYLPGYAASHGCVRMPEQNAIAFFNAIEVGTPVHVFGRTTLQRNYSRYGAQQPRYQRQYRPQFDPRFYAPPPEPWY
ncbi:MAG: L,D-transpeptidase [Verrucomicrobiota bacterium]|nr:L,D-transpeptidase [Verrucomicrobiota bacterium]